MQAESSQTSMAGGYTALAAGLGSGSRKHPSPQRHGAQGTATSNLFGSAPSAVSLPSLQKGVTKGPKQRRGPSNRKSCTCAEPFVFALMHMLPAAKVPAGPTRPPANALPALRTTP